MAASETMLNIDGIQDRIVSNLSSSAEGASFAARRRRLEEQRMKHLSPGTAIAEQLNKKIRPDESSRDVNDELDSTEDGSDEMDTIREATGSIEEEINHTSSSLSLNVEVDIEKEESSMKSGLASESTGDKSQSHGYNTLCGRRREMEDAVAVYPSFMSVPCSSPFGCQKTANGEENCDLHFFGVYDGHGGYQVADYCSRKMHSALAAQIRHSLSSPSSSSSPTSSDLSSTSFSSWQSTVSHSFLKIDAEISGSSLSPYPDSGSECTDLVTDSFSAANGDVTTGADDVSNSTVSTGEALAPETVGSTSVVAIVGPTLIVVANAGDSRAVLSRKGKAIPLSKDHKPDREDEMRRIETAGGRVIYWNGYRVLGVLAMSRAIGDRYLKPYVIPDPEFTFTQRSEDDEFIILASDGLWDVVTNEMACDIARKCFTAKKLGKPLDRNEFPFSVEDIEGPPAAVAAIVLSKIAFVTGSSDNISVVVVDLSSIELGSSS